MARKPAGRKRVKRQSRGTRQVRRQLRNEIYKELGISKGRTTLQATNPQVLRALHPTYDRKSAMYSVAHDFSILPARSRKQFVDRQKVRNTLLQNPKIQGIVEEYPRLGQAFDSMVADALSHRGFKRTTELWRKRKAITRGVKSIDARAKGYSERMNLEMGKAASRLLKGRHAPVLFDVGTGSGSTIIPVVQRMTPQQRANARIALSDVIPTALKDVRKHLVSMGVKPENVTVLPVGFNHIASTLRAMPRQPFLDKKPGYQFRKKLLSLIGKCDLVVSGATFNCFPEARWVLRATKKLLKKGGHTAIWDWAGIETTAKTLGNKQLGRKLFATEGKAPTGRENLLGFSQFWLRSYILDEKRLEEAFRRLERDVNKGKSFNFIKWAERNQDLFERDWKKIEGKGRRNRGYRTTRQLAAGMRNAGMEVERAFFPLYNPNKITQGNNQYIIIARK